MEFLLLLNIDFPKIIFMVSFFFFHLIFEIDYDYLFCLCFMVLFGNAFRKGFKHSDLGEVGGEREQADK